MDIRSYQRKLERMSRSPTDGYPYYCKLCGFGFGEYMACELPDCELESHEDAEKRASGLAIGVKRTRGVDEPPKRKLKFS